jgi:Secretion system C-terminal sorting domain
LVLGCPTQNGLVVFNARIMYNMLNPGQFTMYANNCAGTSNKKDVDEIAIIDASKNAFYVYPNPTSNGFYIGNSSTKNASIEVELFDATGKLLLKQNCEYLGKDCFISSNVANGVYLVKIKNTITNEIQLVKLQVLAH